MRKLLLATVGLVGVVALVAWVAGVLRDSAILAGIGKLLLLGAVLLLLLWLAARLAHAFLWRVGRRLAFSYFLIGVLPIPMVALLTLLCGFLLAGFFLGHVYRDASAGLQRDLDEAARAELARSTEDDEREDIVVATYRKGRKTRGDERLPYLWPSALRDAPTVADRYFMLPDGSPTMVGLAHSGDRMTVAFLSGSLEAELTRRTGIWIELVRSDDPRGRDRWLLRLGSRTIPLQRLLASQPSAGRQEFFGPRTDYNPMDRPWLWWSEISGPLLSVQDGSEIAAYVTATLNATPETVTRHLFSTSAELDAGVWGVLVGASGLLGSLYAIAVAMALAMIYTLSRAVNRLSRATEAVRRADFSVRIPVRRSDQIGELQRSFNQMAANLEASVRSAAKRESLEKELAIARNLQQSLLPADLPRSESVEFATLFEPSAAIGGDYFDIFRVDEERLAVVIADVSGHGLPTGLRMAMLKAALVILVEESKEPVEILRRLSAMVRSQKEERFFVTATVGVVDFRRGVLELTNAGHPPTYLIRDGRVAELLLPGNPLGALGEQYGHSRTDLESEDILVWLSDGLIEITNPAGEPFGYDRICTALEGYSGPPDGARDQLLAAVEAYAEGQPPNDDQTLVAMRYRAAQSDQAS